MTLTIGSLCSGGGGLDLAAADVLGDVRHAWLSEVDTDAARVLAERFPGVPNLGDLTAVDWSTVEPVDVLCAGFPCQPFSVAGKRKGTDDERWIWADIARAIRDVRPRLVMLENPPGILAPAGAGRVLGDLAAFGFDAEWACVSAAEVGAAHRRDRIFFVAAPADARGEYLRLEPVAVGARGGAAVAGGDSPRPDLSTHALLPTPVARDWKGVGYEGQLGTVLLPGGGKDPALFPTPTDRGSNGRGLPGAGLAEARYGQGRRMLDDAVSLLPTPNATDAQGGARQPPAVRTHAGADFGPRLRDIAPLLPTPTATDAHASRNATANRSHVPASTNDSGWTLHDVAYADRWAQYGPAIARWEQVLGRPAPEPTVTGKRGGRRLSARFAEWLMGWPDGWVTDVVDNTPALRICGNGVVRQQGAAAYRALLESIGESL